MAAHGGATPRRAVDAFGVCRLPRGRGEKEGVPLRNALCPRRSRRLGSPRRVSLRRGALVALCTLLLAGCGDPSGPRDLPPPGAEQRLAVGDVAAGGSALALVPASPADDAGDLSGFTGASAEELAAAPEFSTSVSRARGGWSPEAVAGILADAQAEGSNVLVGLPEGGSLDGLAALPGVQVEPVGFGTRMYEVTLPRGRDLGPYAERIVAAGDAVGVNSRLSSLDTTPNDPLYPQQWAFQGDNGGGIRAAQAWDKGTDGSGVLVAVLDTGVDETLSELAANTVPGYDALNGRMGQSDPNGHGTSCAGLIGAVSNNAVGVAGVCWKARILPVRVLGADGSGSISAIVRGIMFAVQSGAKVLNMSLGGPGSSQFMFDALAEARRAGVLVVAAAGNDGQNSDVRPSYPAAYPLDNIVSVAAIDQNGRLASFSNYGAQSVDLAAPGASVIVIKPNRTAVRQSGTSFASPIVAGAATLLWSQNPAMSYQQVRSQLLSGVDPLGSLQGRVATGGRLNLAKVLAVSAPAPAPTPTPTPTPTPAPTPTPTPEPTLVEAESGQVARAGTWQATVRDFHSGGQALFSSSRGATLTAAVSGTSVSLLVSPGPNRGVGRVYLDGRLIGTLDLYASTTRAQVEVTVATGLAPGPHTVRVEALGLRSSRSSGTFFVMDAFRGADLAP